MNNNQQNDMLDKSIDDTNIDKASMVDNTTSDINANGVLMQMDYAHPSQVLSNSADGSLSQDNHKELTQHVALFTELNRQDVKFHADIKSPLLFRDALSALFDVVSSDYRYVPKDRSAYTIFMQMRRANANKNLFTAQQQYFEWLFNNDPLAFCILDPIIQVHQDGISFEVFSRDEGCYAQLTLDHDIFDTQHTSDDICYGTTNIDYSSALYEGIQGIRDYTPTSLNIGHEAVSLQSLNQLDSHTQTDDHETQKPHQNIKTNVIEKRINVPKSWIRSLLQVQSASQLPQDTIELDPIALYNVLFELRMHADIKGKKRGLLIELRPQQLPVIILEPFNIAVTTQISKQSKPYQGSQAKLIRLWGRRRLSLLKRLLPYCKKVSVSLLGQGMPSYWTLSGDGFHFTFAMTGFSQSNWSQALGFDLLLPKRPKTSNLEDGDKQQDLKELLNQIQQQPYHLDKLNKKEKSTAHQQLLTASQQGLIRYDMATQTYYYRPLTQEPLDMEAFAYHNPAEKQAYDLISRTKAITKFSVENLASQGVLIQADIHVDEDRRSYHSQLQLNEEGLVTRAECSCPQFLQHRLTQGVCAHLIALRLAYNDFDPNSNSNPENWQETRILSKRLNTHNGKTNTKSPSITSATTNHDSPAGILDLTALSHQHTDNDSTSTNHSPAGMNHVQLQQIQITLKAKKVIIEYLNHDPRKRKYQQHNHQGESVGNTRQQFIFNQPAQAKKAFLQHIAKFEADGFIENQGV